MNSSWPEYRLGFALSRLAALAICIWAASADCRGEDPLEITPRWFRKLDLFAVEIAQASPLAKDIGFPYKQGYFVAGVATGCPSHQAGVQRGDVIVGMDFKLEEVGKRGLIKVVRRGQIKDLPFTVPRDAFPFPPELAQDNERRVTPATFVVDSVGKGQYRTITAALSVAAPGDTVEIRDGIYHESLVVPRGVILRGAGSGSVRVESSQPLIMFGASAAVVRQIAFHGKNGAVNVCRGSKIVLSDCAISSSAGDAIVGSHVDGLSVRNCSVACPESGVLLEHSKVQVIDSFITNCRWAIALTRQSELESTGNSMDRNANCLLVEASQATLANNTFTGQSPASGIGLAIYNSRIECRENTLQRFQIGCDAREAQGAIEGNTVFQNGFGIRLRAGQLNITSNSFMMNGSAAISLSRQAHAREKPLPNAPLKAIISHNTISSNHSEGISLSDRAEADVDHNLFEGNGYGISVREAMARVLHNTIVLQKNRAIDIDSKSRVEIFNNIVAFNRWGFVVDAAAKWEHGFNNVFGNSASLSFPLASGDYVRRDHVVLADGTRVQTHIYPADDLKAETDVQVDPRFSRVGADYRLSGNSPLGQRKGRDGQLIGAFPMDAATPTSTNGSQVAGKTAVDSPIWRRSIEFRDTIRPDSEEMNRSELVPIRWTLGDRELVFQRLGTLARTATGLFQRAAADGPVSFYRIEAKTATQATGAYRRVTINSLALPRPGYDWLTRIMAHELTHAADPYCWLSVDPEWRALVEPRIAAVHEILKKRNLTTAMAAQMPEGPQRTTLESIVRQETGLPSVYAAHSIEESVAEVVSFMADPTTDYSPPPAIATFLRKRLLDPVGSPMGSQPAEVAYREGLRHAALKDDVAAIAAFSEALRLSPAFVAAYRERGIARVKMNAYADAAADFSKAIGMVSEFSRDLPFLKSERQWCEKKLSP
jgi:parallel beta-helix repeat protein